jgi:23S rRNA-/tRNA-specific pseudouridylate synthase
MHCTMHCKMNFTVLEQHGDARRTKGVPLGGRAHDVRRDMYDAGLIQLVPCSARIVLRAS